MSKGAKPGKVTAPRLAVLADDKVYSGPVDQAALIAFEDTFDRSSQRLNLASADDLLTMQLRDLLGMCFVVASLAGYTGTWDTFKANPENGLVPDDESTDGTD